MSISASDQAALAVTAPRLRRPAVKTLLILGAGGDLTARLLLPGLSGLLAAGGARRLQLVGSDRDDWDDHRSSAALPVANGRPTREPDRCESKCRNAVRHEVDVSDRSDDPDVALRLKDLRQRAGTLHGGASVEDAQDERSSVCPTDKVVGNRLCDHEVRHERKRHRDTDEENLKSVLRLNGSRRNQGASQSVYGLSVDVDGDVSVIVLQPLAST
jgi:hypothetical protein